MRGLSAPQRRGRRRYRDVANSDEASDEEAASPEIQEPAALKPESSWLRDLVCSVGICACILIALLIALFVQVAHRSGYHPLSDAAQAQSDLEAGRTTGSLLLIP